METSCACRRTALAEQPVPYRTSNCEKRCVEFWAVAAAWVPYPACRASRQERRVPPAVHRTRPQETHCTPSTPQRPPPQAEASWAEVNANELARQADEINFNMILILMIVKQVA